MQRNLTQEGGKYFHSIVNVQFNWVSSQSPQCAYIVIKKNSIRLLRSGNNDGEEEALLTGRELWGKRGSEIDGHQLEIRVMAFEMKDTMFTLQVYLILHKVQSLFPASLVY